MNSKHAFLALSVFTLVSIAHGEREVFAPTKLAPVATAANGNITFSNTNPFWTGANISATTNFGIGPTTANVLSFHSNGAERMRISSTGNVFVGNGETVASPATGNIRGAGSTGTNVAGADLVLHGGQSTGTASGGALRFFTAPAGGVSGTSVNASTERMRINSAGAVMLNTTTVSNDTLNVNGRIGQTQSETHVWRDSSTNETAGIVGTSVDANNGYLSLRTRGGGTASEKARVKQGGQLRFVPLSAAPTANVEDGDVYYNSTTNKLQVRAAGVWVDLH